MKNKYVLWGGIVGAAVAAAYPLVLPFAVSILNPPYPNLLLGNLLLSFFYGFGVPYVGAAILKPLVYALPGPLLFLPVVIIYFFIGAVLGKILSAVKDSRAVLIIFWILLATIYFGSALYYVYTHQEVTSAGDCGSSKLYASKDDCYIAAASETKDYSVCEQVIDQGRKSSCVSQVASIRGECEKSSSPDYCYFYASQSIRMYSRDNKCALLTPEVYQKQCFDLTNNKITITDLCSKVSDAKIKRECLAFVIDGIRATY